MEDRLTYSDQLDGLERAAHLAFYFVVFLLRFSFERTMEGLCSTVRPSFLTKNAFRSWPSFVVSYAPPI